MEHKFDFNEEMETNEVEKEENLNSIKKVPKKYFVLAICFVLVLITLGTLSSYAYFQANITNSTTQAKITSSTECINITYANADAATPVELNYNYPISDTYALQQAPVDVKITNNCTGSNPAISYYLTLTTFSETSKKYIPDSKIRYQVKRKLGTANEAVYKNTAYLDALTPVLTSGNAFNLVTQDIASKSAFTKYTSKKIYKLDETTIANGVTNEYKIYLWVDYYEGDKDAYSIGKHTSAGYDNTTENSTFAAAVSLVVNPAS